MGQAKRRGTFEQRLAAARAFRGAGVNTPGSTRAFHQFAPAPWNCVVAAPNPAAERTARASALAGRVEVRPTMAPLEPPVRAAALSDVCDATPRPRRRLGLLAAILALSAGAPWRGR